MTNQKSPKKSGVVGAVLLASALCAIAFTAAPNNAAITDTGGGQALIATAAHFAATPGYTVADIAAPNTPLAQNASDQGAIETPQVAGIPSEVIGTPNSGAIKVVNYIANNTAVPNEIASPQNAAVAESNAKMTIAGSYAAINSAPTPIASPQLVGNAVNNANNLAIAINTGQKNTAADQGIANQSATNASDQGLMASLNTEPNDAMNVSSVNAVGAELLTLKGGNCFGTDSALTSALALASVSTS